jgi:hypothetical protein
MEFNIDINGIRELEAAIARNPARTHTEIGKFLVRGIAVYNKLILRDPWTVQASGGGAPVDTGNLRDTHIKNIGEMKATIGPNEDAAPYAKYVHGLEGYPRKRSYRLRPWLDYAYEKGEKEVRELQDILMDNIVSDLAK